VTGAPFRARDAVCWTQGLLLRGSADASLRGVSIDTRTLGAGELFVAIGGPRHDGHAHLEAASTRGAAGLMVARGRSLPEGLPEDLPIVAVDDTTLALGALASGHRAAFTGPLVAITGSNGKTTTKEMCAAILASVGPCLRTLGNLNNQYGLPLTLLRRSPQDRFAVVEIGMNHRGEIAPLAAIAQPSIALVTNVGTAHIEHLGSRDEIAREKGDLLAALAPEGCGVIPADDDYAAALAERVRGRILRFGRGPGADVRAEAPVEEATGFRFELVAPEGRTTVRVAGLGETAVSNALAASAAALAAGASLAEVALGLAGYRPVAGRLERRALPSGAVLIDDSYNANPQSMEVALRMLASCPAEGRRIAVLGDMGELGPSSDEAHLDAGRLAARLGIHWLLALGEQAERVASGAREAGMSASRTHVGASHEDLAERLRGELSAGDWVLVKGSRSMRMERVAELLGARERS
jgi:UDP-N-acetylmuramoyl-tripeptide--D-alanyl-D-alanine ligase